MKKNIYLSSGVVAAVIAAVSLTCCRPVQQGAESGSNVNISDREASLSLALQQDQTALVRSRIGNVRKALAPIEDALIELNKLADIKVNGEAGLHISTFMKRLQDVLRESMHGVPVAQSDNSWAIERKIELSDLNDETVKSFNAQACMVRIKGKTQDSREVLTVSLMKCHTSEWTPIAQMTYFKSGKVDVTYSPANMSEFLPHSIVLKAQYDQLVRGCSIKITGVQSAQQASMECEPFTLKGDRHSIVFEKLSILSTSAGVVTSVKAEILEEGTGKVLGSLDLADGKAKVIIDTREVKVNVPAPTPQEEETPAPSRARSSDEDIYGVPRRR